MGPQRPQNFRNREPQSQNAKRHPRNALRYWRKWDCGPPKAAKPPKQGTPEPGCQTSPKECNKILKKVRLWAPKGSKTSETGNRIIIFHYFRLPNNNHLGGTWWPSARQTGHDVSKGGDGSGAGCLEGAPLMGFQLDFQSDLMGFNGF